MAIPNLWIANCERDIVVAVEARDMKRARAVAWECMRLVGVALGGTDEGRVYEVFDDLRGNSGQRHRISTHALLQGALRGMGGPDGMFGLFRDLASDRDLWRRGTMPVTLALTAEQRETFVAFLGLLARVAERLA